MLGDVHGNAAALEAVLEAEADANASIFLGDTVLSGPQGNRVLELLRQLPPGPAIMGNHDLELLDPALYGHYPSSWLDLNNWIVESTDRLHIPWVEALLPKGEFTVGGVEVCLHHGMVDGGPRHVLPDSPDEHVMALAPDSASPFVFFGHSHVQFDRTIGGQRFINPGSVGQNRCGHVLACYGVIEAGEYEHRSVAFDPSPWHEALRGIDALEAHPDFRDWLDEGLRTGFGIGAHEPWTGYAERGFR